MVPLAVVALSHVLSMHEAATVYDANAVQTLVPFNPLKVGQVVAVP